MPDYISRAKYRKIAVKTSVCVSRKYKHHYSTRHKIRSAKDPEALYLIYADLQNYKADTSGIKLKVLFLLKSYIFFYFYYNLGLGQ